MNGGADKDNIYGDLGNDSLHGDDGNDQLDGADGNDSVEGDGGNDSLRGSNGDDGLNGGLGTDVIRGGTGVDQAWFDYQTLNQSISLDDVANDGTAGEGDNVRSDVENVVGGSGNDTITGNAANNSLDGADGNDTIKGMGGNDFLYGGSDSDNLDGGDGNDVVSGYYYWAWPGPGEDGADTVGGGTGDDTLYGGDAGDVFGGGAGSDTVSYLDHVSGVTATLDGLANDGAPGENDKIGSDVENLSGSNLADILTGSAGNNRLSGNGGNDTISGLGGNDTVAGNAGNDTLYGNKLGLAGQSGDTLDFSGAITTGVTVNLANAAAQLISGTEGTDTLAGFFGVIGSSLNDTITAASLGGGTIKAGSGNDTIFSRNGWKDTVDGEAGTDSAQVDAVDITSNIETLLP